LSVRQHFNDLQGQGQGHEVKVTCIF
jgi:hypothetical protein